MSHPGNPARAHWTTTVHSKIPLADSPLASSVQHLTCIIKHNSCRMLHDTWFHISNVLAAELAPHWTTTVHSKICIARFSAGLQFAAFNMYHETQFMSHGLRCLM